MTALAVTIVGSAFINCDDCIKFQQNSLCVTISSSTEIRIWCRNYPFGTFPQHKCKPIQPNEDIIGKTILDGLKILMCVPFRFVGIESDAT